MKRLSLIASALAVLGLTVCEKGLVEDIEDVGDGQVKNSLLQVRTRAGGLASDEATISYPVTVYVFQGDECRAVQTIGHWNNVCDAEEQWITPFQETADMMFNSALNIEFAVLRPHVEVILSSVPKNCDEYSEAHRLLKFIHYFIPMDDKEIPPTSIMREFLGGSSFKYKR